MDQGAGRFPGHRSRHRRPTICCKSVWSNPGRLAVEESENDPTRLGARRVWVVDPIDGTRAFIAGREDWSVSVALVVDGRPVLGALFAPATEELFLSTLGGGVTRHTERRRNPGQFRRQPRRCPCRRAQAHDGGDRDQGRRHRADAAHPFAGAAARPGGTMARSMRPVAGGNSHDWDLAAADLLVHEAGGLMTALDGRVLTYNRPDPMHSIVLAAGRNRMRRWPISSVRRPEPV